MRHSAGPPLLNFMNFTISAASCKWTHAVLVLMWLVISLSIMSSRSIYVVTWWGTPFSFQSACFWCDTPPHPPPVSVDSGSIDHIRVFAVSLNDSVQCGNRSPRENAALSLGLRRKWWVWKTSWGKINKSTQGNPEKAALSSLVSPDQSAWLWGHAV